MAFNINYLAKVSSSANSQGLNVWTYNGSATGSDELLATISGAGYFNPHQQSLSAASLAGPIQVGDVFHIQGNDAAGMFRVTSITTNVTLATYAYSENGLIYSEVDIPLADLIGSYTASYELVAAPGAGKKHILHRAVLGIDYGGTVLANGGAIAIQYADDANQGGTLATNTLAAADIIAATADTSFGFSPVDTTLTDATTVNEGLYLATATADFTGGTASTYKMFMWYSTITV